MRTMTILILIILLTLSCKNNIKGLLKDLSFDKLNDSIKKVLKISDSIRVLINHPYSDSSFDYTIIDYNRKSQYHVDMMQQGTSWQDYQKQEYFRAYDSIYPKVKGLIKKRFPKEIQGRWYPIHSFKSDFYLYKPCQFFPIYEVNDTSFVFFYMDGNYPSVLLDYLVKGDTFRFNVAEYNYMEKKIDYKVIEFKFYNAEKTIFLFKESENCSLISNVRDLNKFPIIVEFCTDLFINKDLVFDAIECK
jgi:hypothetical protein